MTKKHHISPALLVFFGAVIFSFGGLLVKVVPWHPISLNSMRNLVALLITVAYIVAIKHKFRINRYILLAGGCLACNTTLFCVTTRLTSSANAILLQYTSPIFIIILSYLIYKQRPRRLDISVCLAIFGGIFFFFMDSLSTGNYLGDALSLVSGIAYAFVFLINLMPSGDAISAFLVGQVLSFFIGLPFLVGESDFTFWALGGAALLGLSLGAGYVLIGVALTRGLPSVTANLVGTTETVLNPVWVAIFYGEVLSVYSIIGFVIVIGSVVMYNIVLARKIKGENQN